MHSTASTMMRRTAFTFMMRSAIESGRATSPMAPPISVSSTTRSGRRGGSMRTTRCAVSAIVRLRGERGLDPVGEQEVMDAPVQLLESGRADLGKAQVIRVELGLDAAGMRRKHQDAAADQDCLLDGMRHEKHREAD